MSEICVTDREGQSILALNGSLDASRVPDLLAAAITLCDSGKPVVLDWESVDYLHAGALQVLLALQTGMAAQERPLQVLGCSPAVRDSLATAGLLDRFAPIPARKEVAFADGTHRG